MVKETIESYLRTRARARGLSLSEVCRQAHISRQTLYSLTQLPRKIPALQTVVSLAEVLHVHPMRLLQLIFDELPPAPQDEPMNQQGDRSAFVQETIPDGTLVLYGQRFSKTWELQNVGLVPWEGRHLQCLDEEIVVYRLSGEKIRISENLMPDAPRIPVPLTLPGDLVRLTVNFTAPSMPGTFISYWKSVFEDGSSCFPKAQGLSVKVRVNTLATAAVEAL